MTIFDELKARGLLAQLTDEEEILSKGLTEENIKEFSLFAINKISTGSNARAGAEYRSRLIGVLSQRLFKKIMEEQ